MKHPKQVGMSCKNTRFIKAGLTESEKIYVAQASEQIRLMWEDLFSRNKWTPQEIPKKVIASKKTNTKLPTNNQ